MDLVNARLAVLSGRPAYLPADASPQVSAELGRPAVGLWIAHNAAAEFVSSYDDIEARLRNEILRSRWRWWRCAGPARPPVSAGHVFMLRRIGDQVFIDDPEKRDLGPWTPQLQHRYAAAKIAVGWLDDQLPTHPAAQPRTAEEAQLHPVREIGNAAVTPRPTPTPTR